MARALRLTAASLAAVTLVSCGHHVSKLSDNEAQKRLRALLQQTADAVDPDHPHRVTNPFQGSCSDFLNRDYAHRYEANADVTFPVDENASHFYGRVLAYWRSRGFHVDTVDKGGPNERIGGSTRGFSFGAETVGRTARELAVADGRHKANFNGETPCLKGT